MQAQAPAQSAKSLDDPEIATMEGGTSAYNQSEATGFTRLNALRLKLRARQKETQLARGRTIPYTQRCQNPPK